MQFALLGSTLSVYVGLHWPFETIESMEPLWYITAASTVLSGLGYMNGSGMRKIVAKVAEKNPFRKGRE